MMMDVLCGRSHVRAREADLVLSLFAVEAGIAGMDPATMDLLQELPVENVMALVTKADLAPAGGHGCLELESHLREQGWQPSAISCASGEGIESLLGRVTAAAKARLEGTTEGEAPPLTRARHRGHLVAAVEALERYEQVPPDAVEFAGEELRAATRELGRITGRVDVEELLDVIFRDFCVGK